MTFKQIIGRTIVLIFISLIVVACQKPAVTPTATAVSPTHSAPTPTLTRTTVTSPPQSTETAVLATATFIPSSTPAATATRVAETATAVPSPQPTATQPAPIVTTPPQPTAAPTAVPAAIDYFELVEVEDINPGKRITLRWSATGDSASIDSGTGWYRPRWWSVPPSGTQTFEIAGTAVRDPIFALHVYDGIHEPVKEIVQVEWACEHACFFTPAPRRCPHNPATTVWAAEQRFEHGRMIWLPEPFRGEGGGLVVLYEDGGYGLFEDTWTPEEPESDPAIVPPEGLYQPVRGFGKVWRNAQVRERLGWAVAPEQGYESTWQYEIAGKHGLTINVRTIDNQVIRVGGGSSWEVIAP